MTLNTTRSKVPDICDTSVIESQISVRYSLQPSIFELQAILRQVHRMTPKCYNVKYEWILQCQRYTIYVLPMSMGPKFKSFWLYDLPFWSYRPFWNNCTEWPQMILHTTRSNIHHRCVTSVVESQISLCFTLQPAVLEIWTILRQVYPTTPKWPWTLQGQRYLCMFYYNCPQVPNFSPFLSSTSGFLELQVILRQMH